MLPINPTVTIAKVPSLAHITSGCGSVSDITPMPTLPEKRGTSSSNLERNGEFWMLCIALWNTPPSPNTAIPPRCVPRCEW